MPTLRILTVPAGTYYPARVSTELMRPIAELVFNDLVKALTTPLTDAEKNPPPKVIDVTTPIKITGRTYNEALEFMQQIFLTNRWIDSLPIIPPTAEAVKWMMTGTTRSPKEVLGVMAPKDGEVTIEKVAINAVMAGARPEYFPVIIAAAECLASPDFYTLHLQASTGSEVPVIIVNGPIIQEIGMNFEMGFMGDSCRPNSTIGRAVSLCMISLGWAWSQFNDQGLTGRPEGYCNFVIPENERDSPWMPYHVELGYKPEECTVTVASSMAYTRHGSGGAVTALTVEENMQSLANNIATVGTSASYVFRTGVNAKRYVVTIQPALSRDLAKLGYDKQKLKLWLYDHALFPWDDLFPVEKTDLEVSVKAGRIPGVTMDDLKPGGGIRAFRGPDHMTIVVAGGEPCYCCVFCYPGPHTPPSKPDQHITKKIYGAALTKAGK